MKMGKRVKTYGSESALEEVLKLSYEGTRLYRTKGWGGGSNLESADVSTETLAYSYYILEGVRNLPFWD